MYQRGMSHVEIILASVLFIGAVLFALYFFTTKHTSEDPSFTPYLLEQLSRNTSVGVEQYSLALSAPESTTFLAVNLSRTFAGVGVQVVNYTGAILPSSLEHDIIYFERQGNEKLVFVRVSPDLRTAYGTVHSKGQVQEHLYALASKTNITLLSEQRLLALNTTYTKEYEQTKAALGLGAGYELGIAVSFSEGDRILMEKPLLLKTTVYAKTKRVEILRTDGRFVFGDVEVKIW